MKKIIIGAAVLAALSLAAIILGIIVFTQREQESTIIELQPVAAASETPVIAGATDIPKSTTTPTPMPTPTGEATPVPTASPTMPPQKEGEAFFTLDIRGSAVSVAYGVEEKTLEKTPGWLTSSALPGEDGMCVVYGHRNRNHLRILKDVEYGDIITVTMRDGAVHQYSVMEIIIFESTDDLRLPTADNAELTLVTCYPFRYTGNAPGKYLVRAVLTE